MLGSRLGSRPVQQQVTTGSDGFWNKTAWLRARWVGFLVYVVSNRTKSTPTSATLPRAAAPSRLRAIQLLISLPTHAAAFDVPRRAQLPTRSPATLTLHLPWLTHLGAQPQAAAAALVPSRAQVGARRRQPGQRAQVELCESFVTYLRCWRAWFHWLPEFDEALLEQGGCQGVTTLLLRSSEMSNGLIGLNHGLAQPGQKPCCRFLQAGLTGWPGWHQPGEQGYSLVVLSCDLNNGPK